MPKIRRTSSGVRLQLRAEEVWLLSTVVESLDQLLEGGSTPKAEADADGVLAGLDWGTSPVDAPTDPALRRLLPDAYPDDEQAAAEFRRYTDGTLRDGMRADVAAVSERLREIDGGGTVSLDADAGESWLRMLTEARLVLATRLGIATADDQERLDAMPPDDPRAGWYVIYTWLGMVLSGLLDVLG